MKNAIAFVLGNFTLTFFVLGLVASAIALWHARPPRSAAVIVEALFSYFLLFSIGLASFYNFVLHVFFGEAAASFIGWADSPFQQEVGFASLGMAALGFLAFGEASTCGLRPSSPRPAFCGARPPATFIR
jgi:hypothetical protein